MPLELGPLLASLGLHSMDSSDKVLSTMAEIRTFHDIVSKFKQMQVDPTEYACLRAIVLFKTGEFLYIVPRGERPSLIQM